MGAVIQVAASVWLAIGAVVAILFLTVGAGRLLPAIRGGSVVFRVWILPSCALLWPVVVFRWSRLATGKDRP